MEAEIQAELSKIEASENVRIIFAIESGSRAWGFPSADSDFDVRFVYARPTDWYLSVSRKRDVIEQPIVGLLDVSGWDLRKALHLLRKSNPALMEWLTSPIIYREHSSAQVFRDFADHAFLPLASCHHYRSMLKQHQSRAEIGDKVRLKVYLYALRPLLAARWVIRYGAQPPMLFSELVEEFLPSGEIRGIVDDLVGTKMSGVEADTVNRIEELDQYLIAGRKKIEDWLSGSVTIKPEDFEVFDIKFRELLSVIWVDG
ncbi:MAG: nucleotidyltransferase domain-containing protein [Cyanobacteria bacterium P01_F01_bin.153]